MMTKKELREKMRVLEAAFRESGAAGDADARAIAAVESSDAFRDGAVVLSYMSIPGEVSTHEANARWTAMGKKVVLPLVVGDDLVLKEYDPALLVPGYRGILEPSADAVDVDPSEVDLVLVPGVAFTRSGKRLGRGKGYYDRLLPKLDCPKLGLCYGFRIVDDIPSDPWDVVLDGVIYG